MSVWEVMLIVLIWLNILRLNWRLNKIERYVIHLQDEREEDK